MKKTFAFLSFSVILAAMATLATAGSAVVLHGDIPFDFYVDNQVLPAGEYNFEMGRIAEDTTANITVRAKDGKVVALVTTRPGMRQDATPSQIIFKKYNGRYFLTSVECPGYKAELKKMDLMVQPPASQLAMTVPEP